MPMPSPGSHLGGGPPVVLLLPSPVLLSAPVLDVPSPVLLVVSGITPEVVPVVVPAPVVPLVGSEVLVVGSLVPVVGLVEVVIPAVFEPSSSPLPVGVLVAPVEAPLLLLLAPAPVDPCVPRARLGVSARAVTARQDQPDRRRDDLTPSVPNPVTHGPSIDRLRATGGGKESARDARTGADPREPA